MTQKKKPAPASKSKVKTIKKKKPISKKPPARKVSAKKPAAKKAAKPKPLTKKQSVKNSSKPSSKSTAKPAKAVNKAAAAAKPAKTAQTAPVAAKAKTAKAPAEGKQNTRNLLRNRILGKAKSSKPIAFSLDEVREIAKTVADKAESVAPFAKPSKAKSQAKIEQTLKASKPHHVKAASLADVLGFNPKKTTRITDLEEAEIPDKFKRYYKLLVQLRNHVTGQLDQHTEETLKRSSKEDSGDLSSYGQHMADAGTDTFDRDFALSLVSNEQEALSEIEAAIQRIKAGTYGVCEITQKPIARERLLAVPFTRHSTEAQKQIERNHHRTRTQAGLFESGEDGAKMTSDDGDDD